MENYCKKEDRTDIDRYHFEARCFTLRVQKEVQQQLCSWRKLIDWQCADTFKVVSPEANTIDSSHSDCTIRRKDLRVRLVENKEFSSRVKVQSKRD